VLKPIGCASFATKTTQFVLRSDAKSFGISARFVSNSTDTAEHVERLPGVNAARLLQRCLSLPEIQDGLTSPRESVDIQSHVATCGLILCAAIGLFR
jgi:hypothetical protein